MGDFPRCDRCGRFHKCEPGSAWRMVYSGALLEHDHEKTRCKSCVERHGPFHPQTGIKPEFSCGLVQEHPR
jgi:hypothetical protein